MSGAGQAAVAPPARVVPLALLLGGLFGLGALGSTAMAVVLPEAAAALDVPISQSTWFISLYALTMAVSTPVYGRLVDIVGVRIPLLIGVVLTTLGAVLAATATDFALMVVARLLQGLGTGVGPTLGAAVIGTRFDGNDRTKGLAIVAGTGGALGATGPLLGGLAESVATWRGAVALPAMGLVILVLLWRRVRGPGAGSTFDVLGAMLVALAAGGVIMLLQSPSSGVVVALLGACLAGVGVPLVLRRSRRGPHVFLPASVLDPRIVRTCLIAGTVPMAWFALLVAVPTRLGDKGWSPALVGFALLPGAVMTLIAPRVTPWVTRRVGPSRGLVIAAGMASVALVICGLGVLTGWAAPMIVGVAVVGAAFGLGQPSLFAVVGELAAIEVRGIATGFATLVFLMCGSAGSAVVGGFTVLIGVHGGLLVLAAVGGIATVLAGWSDRRERRVAAAR